MHPHPPDPPGSPNPPAGIGEPLRLAWRQRGSAAYVAHGAAGGRLHVHSSLDGQPTRRSARGTVGALPSTEPGGRCPGPVDASRRRTRTICSVCRVYALICAVDSGFAVDQGYYRAPDQPQSPTSSRCGSTAITGQFPHRRSEKRAWPMGRGGQAAGSYNPHRGRLGRRSIRQ